MRFTIKSNEMAVTKCVDKMMRVKIRSCQVIKLILTGFVVVQEDKALGLNAQTSQARSVLLRPLALYFPVKQQNRLVCAYY